MIAARIRDIQRIAEPWPHAVLDDFFPPDVFADLIAGLPELEWGRSGGKTRKAKKLPPAVSEILESEKVLDAIRQEFGFTGGVPTTSIVYREERLFAHCDRKDKFWSGQVYLTGDPKGTELYDADGKRAGVIPWRDNRLCCWTRPPQSEKHAAPESSGRYVLLWWILEQ